MNKKLLPVIAVVAATIGLLASDIGNSSAQTYPVVLQTTGNGDATTATFTTGSDWALRWTFACPSTGSLRVVEQGGPQSGIVLVDEHGPAGGATMYSHNVPGAHSLVVTSDCQWTLGVTDGDLLPHA